jgi:hypothetical protein
MNTDFANRDGLVERLVRETETIPLAIREDAAAFRVQAIVSFLPRPGESGPIVSHSFRADEEYFYPASTIKLPTAIAALDALSDPLMVAAGVTEHSRLRYHPCFEGESVDEVDPSNLQGGAISIGHDARHALIVSDNVAHNRLFEFLGHEGTNRRLRGMGLLSVGFNHRLSEPHSREEHRRTPRIEAFGSRGRVVLPSLESGLIFDHKDVRGIEVGRACIEDDRLIERPFSFGWRNRISLKDLHRLVIAVVRPDLATGVRMELPEERRRLVLEAMEQFPRQSTNPDFRGEHPDEFVKPLLPGLRAALGHDGFRMWNKIGWAYGFMTDTACVHDLTLDSWYSITATMHTSPGGVIGGDDYEYDVMAKPFFAGLASKVAGLNRARA